MGRPMMPRCRRHEPGAPHKAAYRTGKPYAPPVSGTEPRFARVGAMLGWPVNAAGAGFFFFFVWFFLVFSFYCFLLFFYFIFFFRFFA
jgi:hypothetical protein